MILVRLFQQGERKLATVGMIAEGTHMPIPFVDTYETFAETTLTATN